MPTIGEVRKYFQEYHGRTKRHAKDLAQRVFNEPARSMELLPFEWHAALHPKFAIAPEPRRSAGISDPTGNAAVRNAMSQENGLEAQSAKICFEAVNTNPQKRN